MSKNNDERFMRRAVLLSKRGFTAPNPHVGCVLTQNGVIVGEGWHAYAGGDHAEVAALKQAGENARGSTAYVTLEPCNHFGKTPPCALALIEAEVKRVVVACKDPNPKAKGGLTTLAEAGIETDLGLLADQAREANEPFFAALALNRPYVVVKAAMSLDGRIALPSGESKWITSPQSRRTAHRLRAECGAVLVGRKTVEADDPLLTVRLPGVVNQPLRVVLDPHGKLSGRESVFQQPGESLHVTSSLVPLSEEGIDLRALLEILWKRRVMGLLVEGGAHTITSFIKSGLVDRFELFMAPKLLGSGSSWLNDLAVSSIADGPQLQILRIRRSGPDLWVTAKPQRP